MELKRKKDPKLDVDAGKLKVFPIVPGPIDLLSQETQRRGLVVKKGSRLTGGTQLGTVGARETS